MGGGPSLLSISASSQFFKNSYHSLSIVLVRVELGKALTVCAPDLFTQRLILDQLQDFVGQITRVLLLAKKSVDPLLDDFGNCGTRRGNDRQTRSHRLQQHQSKCLVVIKRGKYKNVGLGKQPLLGLARGDADKLHLLLNLALADDALRLLALFLPPPSTREFKPCVGSPRHDSRDRLQEYKDAFLSNQIAQIKHRHGGGVFQKRRRLCRRFNA